MAVTENAQMNPLRIRIDERRLFADGVQFAQAGAYERLSGRVLFAVDPAAPAYAAVVDLDKAPRNRDGLVEFAADLCVLKPVDSGCGNRRVLFGYGNRGNKRELQFFNDARASNDPIAAADAGNGFLMRRGYTVVWAAWEGDLLPGDGRMVLDVPIARDGDRPLTGLVRTEFIADAPGVRSMPLSGHSSTLSYPTVSMDTRDASLTRRRYPGQASEPVDPGAWCFARLEAGMGLDGQGRQSALVASDSHIYLRGGFEPGWIHELVYTARDPRVMGLGHVVVRDLLSFLKYGDTDGAGQPSPVGQVEKVYAWGRSQTGRALRDFVHGGWNVDAAGRRVLDGVFSHVAGAGLMWMNHRFASVVCPAGQQYEAHHNCADRFPFSYARCTDHLTGRSDAILKRPDTDPLVIHTQTATEYWQRRGSLVHTDTRGNDLAQPEGVRLYFWSSSQHFADPHMGQPTRGVCQQPANVVSTSMLFRALLDALDAWASRGVAPPPSRIPLRGDGTLVSAEAWRERFPAIPGVALPRGPSTLALLDFGERFEAGILDREPPRVVAAPGYPTLVPAVDEDGNDVAGVRAPMVQAPLATYTGWSLRARGFGHGAMFMFNGSTMPFADTEAERLMTGDPRRSVQARYGTREGYVRAIEAAARTLVADGLMLDEDLARCVQAAADWAAPRHDVRLD
jgi:hypothetical protein